MPSAPLLRLTSRIHDSQNQVAVMMEVVAQIVLEIICGTTGHLVLWVFTLGRWKLFDGRDEIATVVGILFWVVVGLAVWIALK